MTVGMRTARRLRRQKAMNAKDAVEANYWSTLGEDRE